PVDSNIDYALWLTTKELAPRWRPAFERGDLNFGNDADQIAYGFSALGSGAPVELLMKDLYADHVTAEKRQRLAQLICYSANADQMGQLFSMASARLDGELMKLVLLHSGTRKITPSVNAEDVRKLLKSEDPAVGHSALRAIGQWKIADLRSQLEEIVLDHKTDTATLDAAFEGIGAGRDDSLLTLLEKVGGAAESSFDARSMAIEQLASAKPAVAASLAASLFMTMPEGASPADVARALLSEKEGSRLLTASLNGKERRIDVARDILRVLRESGRTDGDLENTLRTAGKIASRKSLTDEERAAILEKAKTAKASDGELIYRNEKLNCQRCHAIGGAGGLVGPDMISLGASAQPDYLLESLLNPNAKVKENYHTTVVATASGEVLAGVQVQKSDKTLTLRNAENKLIEISVADIEEQTQGVSLMPEGLVDNLTDDEIASLVRFLSELGRTPEYTLSRNRLLRSWQVVLPTQEAFHQLNRTSFSQVAANESAFSWSERYSVVAGALPLQAIPVMKVREVPVGFARCRINVTTPGQIGFRMNSVAGTEVRIDGVPVEPAAEFTADLAAGLHSVILTIDTAKRGEPILLELIGIEGGGNAELVNP
ncbi:MAG: hypothetical protein ACK58L_06465, partial [Planctomycetota bacterium]